MASSFEPKSKEIADWWSERVNRGDLRVTALDRRKIAGVYVDPTYVNGWGNAGDPWEDFQYRLFAIDTLQVKGALAGGTTGTVAFTLLPPWIPAKNIPIVGAVLDTGVYIPAWLDINASNGEVTVNF